MSLIIIAFVVLAFYIPYRKFKKGNHTWRHPKRPFPDEWRQVLEEHVTYYNELSDGERTHFEWHVHRFLFNVKITGKSCEVDHKHKVLVAAGATIPVFAFREWEYVFLQEVVLYPSAFEFPGEGPYKGKKMHGVVGGGKVLQGKLLLSMQALRAGFQDDGDMRNVAIHEFMHLIDKADGRVDGIPGELLSRQFTLPWIHLMLIKIREVRSNDSDIRQYGARNLAEFLAVISEYFFERPQDFRENHPRLYKVMSEMFRQQPHRKRRLRS